MISTQIEGSEKALVELVKKGHKTGHLKFARYGVYRTFTNMLDYKCILIELSARDTSVNCSRCGKKVPKNLAVRIHHCDKCGLVLDRYYNASINILKRWLNIFNKLPQELREVTSVEIGNQSIKQKETNGFCW